MTNSMVLQKHRCTPGLLEVNRHFFMDYYTSVILCFGVTWREKSVLS